MTITASPIMQTAWVIEDIGATERHFVNQLELIQPVSGASIYSEYLRDHRGGLHHLCMIPTDFDAALAAAEADGIGIAQQGSMAGGAMRVYLDGAHVGVPFIELAELAPMMVEFFDSIREQTT